MIVFLIRPGITPVCPSLSYFHSGSADQDAGLATCEQRLSVQLVGNTQLYSVTVSGSLDLQAPRPETGTDKKMSSRMC